MPPKEKNLAQKNSSTTKTSPEDEKKPAGRRSPKSATVNSSGEKKKSLAGNTSGGGKAGTSGKSKPVAKKKRPTHAIEVLLGETLVNASGETIPSKSLNTEDGVIGLYFGAKWCPPCKVLLAELLLLYEEVRNSGQKFDVVLVSFDSTEKNFKEYLSLMPWWAMEYDDQEQREEVAHKYNVRGIPVFVLIEAKSLEVITRDGRELVSYDPKGTSFPWRDFDMSAIKEGARKALKDKVKELASELIEIAANAKQSILGTATEADVTRASGNEEDEAAAAAAPPDTVESG